MVTSLPCHMPAAIVVRSEWRHDWGFTDFHGYNRAWFVRDVTPLFQWLSVAMVMGCP